MTDLISALGIAVEKNSTIVFPLPVELLRLMDRISLRPDEKP